MSNRSTTYIGKYYNRLKRKIYKVYRPRGGQLFYKANNNRININVNEFTTYWIKAINELPENATKTKSHLTSSQVEDIIHAFRESWKLTLMSQPTIIKDTNEYNKRFNSIKNEQIY